VVSIYLASCRSTNQGDVRASLSPTPRSKLAACGSSVLPLEEMGNEAQSLLPINLHAQSPRCAWLSRAPVFRSVIESVEGDPRVEILPFRCQNPTDQESEVVGGSRNEGYALLFQA
jgi:hypothetical protein